MLPRELVDNYDRDTRDSSLAHTLSSRYQFYTIKKTKKSYLYLRLIHVCPDKSDDFGL